MTFHYFKNKIYCDVHRHTFASDGTCQFCKSGSSQNDEQLRANDEQLRRVPKRVTRKYVKKHKTSIYERFHNFGVKFKAIIQHEALFKLEQCQFGKTKFKRLDFPEAIVKVFKESILVTLRKNQEIIGLPVKDAESKSIEVLNGVLDRLPKSIIIKDRSIVNVHNAFVNHPFAKHDLNIKVDGETRLITDHSKGQLEFEAVNPVHAVSDSEAIEQDTIGLIDKGLSREVLADSIHKLVQDREYYAENLKSHVQAINTLSKKISEFKSLNSQESSAEVSCSDSPLFPQRTFSKHDIDSKSKEYRLWKAQQLLKEFGWGGSIW